MQNVSEQEKIFAATQMNQPVKSIVPTLLRAFSVVIVIFGSLVSWLLKDGLGPDSVSSVGFVSFMRYLQGLWPFGVAALIFFVVSFLVRRTHNRNASTQRT
jgi:hypothetical protein